MRRGVVVLRRWQSDGVDCDGRLTRSGVDYCVREYLQSGHLPYLTEGELADPMIVSAWEGVRYPAWVAGERSQCDEYAEAAGY